MALEALRSLFANSKATTAQVQDMSAATAIKFHGGADTIFVDVRGAAEIAQTGTIKGAVHVPLQELARHADPSGRATLPAVDSDKTIILVCASGMRSANAAQQLIELGYRNVATIVGGIGQWKSAGGAIQ